MPVLIVADIHANLDALEAVIHHAEASGSIDAVWCLGDTVGYGAEPDGCIERLREFRLDAIAGNHDLAAIGAISTGDFNPHAAFAAAWTGEHLSAASRAWIADLPQVVVVADEFTLTHGSLLDPVWEYLVYSEAAEDHLSRQATPYGFVGHSHLPLLFCEGEAGARIEAEAVLTLDVTRFVANPGSVGQPRDGDPRAAYAIFDNQSREVKFHRVEYDVAGAQAKIRAAGLPEVLAARLSVGR